MRSRPWEHATGPRTADGKASSSRNAYRGGTRETFREIARLMREQQQQVREVLA